MTARIFYRYEVKLGEYTGAVDSVRRFRGILTARLHSGGRAIIFVLSPSQAAELETMCGQPVRLLIETVTVKGKPRRRLIDIEGYDG